MERKKGKLNIREGFHQIRSIESNLKLEVIDYVVLLCYHVLTGDFTPQSCVRLTTDSLISVGNLDI